MSDCIVIPTNSPLYALIKDMIIKESRILVKQHISGNYYLTYLSLNANIDPKVKRITVEGHILENKEVRSNLQKGKILITSLNLTNDNS